MFKGNKHQNKEVGARRWVSSELGGGGGAAEEKDSLEVGLDIS